MRLADAERERLFEQLARHAAAGRLDIEEHERRVELLARATTRDEAAAAFADLPPGPLPPASTTEPGGAGQSPSGSGRRRFWLRHGHGDADRPHESWTATTERFRDPRTGLVMRVWVDAGGGRHYVPDD